MKLLEYVKTKATQRGLAQQLAISPVLINQWANDKRPIPADRCVEIERATNGEVTRPELRPADWQRIWPELAELYGAAPDSPKRRISDAPPPS